MFHILSTSNEIICEEIGDYYLVFCNAFCPVPTVSRNTTKCFLAQTRGDDLLVMSMFDPLFFFFYCLWSETGGYFSLDNYSILCLWQNWF